MEGHAELVRTIVEQCWSDPAGLERMRSLVTPDYLHHTAMGREWSFDQFSEGVAWIDERISDRSYLIAHLLLAGDMAAAYISWHGARREDSSAVHGCGAYHCRIHEGRVAEDWDVFFPPG